MANEFSVKAGANPGRPVKNGVIWTGEFASGLWTNRSPLRDGPSTRNEASYYGSQSDTLIAGQNVEISNKLTLIKRPGNSKFSANPFSAISRFYDFRTSNSTTEQIQVMIDTANAVYSLDVLTDVSTLLWTKSQAAQGQQTYFQGVGNTLFFSNGVDQKKYLASLTTWAPGKQWNTSDGQYPYLSTFLIDPFGNLQQLAGTVIPILQTAAQADRVLVFTGNFSLSKILTVGQQITFPAGMAASVLDGVTATIIDIEGSTFLFNLVTNNYALTNETNKYASVFEGDGSPISGNSQPMWSTSVPQIVNGVYTQGSTYDGTALWINHGSPVQNWGIQPPTNVLTPTLNGSYPGWAATTYYSPTNSIIDSNGNVQTIVQTGESGATEPVWKTALGQQTQDGSGSTALIWEMTRSAAQLNWAPSTSYPTGSLVIGAASGTPYLFRSSVSGVPYIDSSVGVSAYLYSVSGSGPVGQVSLLYPQTQGSANASATGLTGFNFAITSGSSGPINWAVINNAGHQTGTVQPFGSFAENLNISIIATIQVPEAGTYNFSFQHGDGLQVGFSGGAALVSGTPPVDQIGTQTLVMGFPVMPFGHNQNITANGGSEWTDTAGVNFPTPGAYQIELNYARWDKNPAGMAVTVDGNTLTFGQGTGGGVSGTTQPTWPVFSEGFAPGYASVTESSGQLIWDNIGPVSDFAWHASTNYALPIPNLTPATYIVDGNGNVENPFRSGVSGSSSPSFSTTVNDLTNDSGTLVWINAGIPSIPAKGNITTSNGGWIYTIAIFNSIDQTMSNAAPVSAPTGDFTDAVSVNLEKGAGLQTLLVSGRYDLQADWVSIFRSTDGQTTPFLIPGNNDYNIPATLPLSVYLAQGYQDTTPDTGLNNLISAPILGENTPPAPGAINLAYYLSRLFYSVGATVNWTSGPATPAGNGLNGTSPLNFDEQASLVKRIVPTTPAAIVFTVSDINAIYAPNPATNPIEPAVPLLEGTGVSSYNAIDISGSTIGAFTTDSQFVILDSSLGLTEAGFPLADQFEQNNGQPGTSWNPASVYVAWHVSGTDKAWFVSDGKNGWYKLISTPIPERGYTWSPFADIEQGAGAVQSIEVTPGVHKLLVGPTGTGMVLQRDLTVNADNGIPYPAYAVLGSAVLAQPGQVAHVPFIVTSSVKTGSPLVLGIIVDEALPYYTGPFDILKHWVSDPPNLKTSQSFYNQRFYMSELDEEDAAVMANCQIQISWPAENYQNELLTLSIFGGYSQEGA